MKKRVKRVYNLCFSKIEGIPLNSLNFYYKIPIERKFLKVISENTLSNINKFK